MHGRAHSSKPVSYRPNDATSTPAAEELHGGAKEVLLKGMAQYGRPHNLD